MEVAACAYHIEDRPSCRARTYMESAHAAAAGIRALVVDDDSAVRAFVERVLRDAGYETTAAPDGVAACELVLRSGPPHIVVTDESMPRMSGHEFSRWIRQRHPGVKVLYLTGYADPVFRDHRDLWEEEGYLDKPCTIRGLLQAVSLLLFRRLEAFMVAPPTAEM